MDKQKENLAEREINLLPEEKRNLEMKERARMVEPVMEVSLHESVEQTAESPMPVNGWWTRIKNKFVSAKH